MECLNCKAVFESKTSRAKYCSDKCKTAYARTVTEDSTVTPVTVTNVTIPVTVTHSTVTKPVTVTKPDNYGQFDCSCNHCKANIASGSKSVINHGEWKPYTKLSFNELNRVSSPGDWDYKGCCIKDNDGVWRTAKSA